MLIVSLFLTVFCVFLLLFRRLFLKKDQIAIRINRYLINTNDKKETTKKINFTFNLNGPKQKVREKLLTKGRNEKLELLLYRAGVPLRPEEYVMFQWIAVSLGAGLLYLVVGHILILPIGGFIGFFLPRVILQKKQKKRLKAFNDNLPEMISSVIGALKAGFSFPQALKSVMEEAQSPMKEELETVLREMQYGTTTEEALNHLKERMPSEDLDLMIQAIIIQRQVGGNLTIVLEKIVTTIRDRLKIQGQISTLTAQGRLSGMVVGFLPVILGAFLYVIEPDYIGTLFSHTIGKVLVVIAIISCLIGFILIRKITTIEV